MTEIGGLTNILRLLFFAGAAVFFLVILYLLKRGRLNVQYSIIWLGAALAMLIFAIWPMLIIHLRALFGVETGANLVFILLFVFVLLVLLSLSTIVTGFAAKIKRLTQTQALLEKRLRELEQAQKQQNTPPNQQE